ncbi:cytochrome P450, family 51 (sterol 14-demethylase) [Fusarium oxysporum f. sp. radicis-lycopersici 26381]|nr:cytochrome P450, family 51 (sterol 14-demethylase) [Fusarium oxysporum f. sp. radicis-lycopersici 26381]WKT54143.1 hypothetical protein QSH57_004727 [Fusarium oxysporum f. sp. vasinfectum]
MVIKNWVLLGPNLPSAPNGVAGLALFPSILIIGTSFIFLSVVIHILRQLLFNSKSEPPLVFSWVPILGSTIEYGIDPYKFFFKYREKYGNTFTFILLGKKHTVCLGTEGNDFVLNGKLSEMSAADIYRDLTVPIFEKGVLIDEINHSTKDNRQDGKQLLKYSLTTEKLETYVPIFNHEVQNFLETSHVFKGQIGVFEVVETMGVISIFTASRCLQGKEVRENLNAGLADLYHDLDASFIPINFFFPWVPLPVNRRRDKAQKKVAAIYKNIIAERRKLEESKKEHQDDMIWHLMRSEYKDGTPVPDHEIAHIMIAMLMAGQHTSSSIGAWILLRLATRPDIQEELYQEQLRVLGSDLPLPTRDGIGRLTLHRMVVRETLRLHAPIHSMMRAAKSPLTFATVEPGSTLQRVYSIPTSHVLISAPGVTAQSAEYFANPDDWEPHRWEHMTEILDGTEKPEPGYLPVSRSTSSSYLPFAAGRHRCIGEHFAYLQLGTITALMVREFKFCTVAGKEGIAATDYGSLFTRPVVPAFLQWERRSPLTPGDENRSTAKGDQIPTRS